MGKLIQTLYKGEMRTIRELCAETGISSRTFYKYLSAGMSADEIVSGTLTGHGRRWPYHGEMLTVRELSERGCASVGVLNYRLREGWDVEEAVHTPVGTRPNRVPPPRMEKPPQANTPEGRRWNAAQEICKTIAVSPAAFNFRCTEPMTEYMFESDTVGYNILFLSPHLAILTAYYRNKEIPCRLYRVFEVDGEKVKEVEQR